MRGRFRRDWPRYSPRDLRNAPFIAPRAFLWPYGPLSAPPEGLKVSYALPDGAQALMVAAGHLAEEQGVTMNHLLTVQWSSLRAFDDWSDLWCEDTVQRIRKLIDLMRRWHRKRGVKLWAYAWVREISPSEGEHWHLAFHCPEEHAEDLILQLEAWLGEPLRAKPRTKAEGATRGEIACSEQGSWHLGQSDQVTDMMLAYLGKGEPSQIEAPTGKLVDNTGKLYRGTEYGGHLKNPIYDADQGWLPGTPDRYARYDIAKPLKGVLKGDEKKRHGVHGLLGW